MPHAWALVDSSFPTFRGDEKPAEQVEALVEYMKILTEALQYQLENLDAENWNTAALKSFQVDTTADIAEQIAAQAANLTIVVNEVTRIEGRLNALESLSGRVNNLETEVGYLEQSMDEQEQRAELMEESIDYLQAEMDELQNIILKDEQGTTIGKEGEDLRIVGNVYVNGVLIG